MAQAVGQNIIVKQIDQPEDTAIKTPDGKHPYAIEVIDVSDNLDTQYKEGDIVAAQGGLKELANDLFIVNYSQIAAILDEEEL